MKKDWALKRAQYRLSVQLKFSFRHEGAPANCLKQPSRTKDISAGGLLFANKEQIPIDTVLEIEIDMPGVPELTLDLRAKVVRLERISLEEFDIGVSFMDLSEDNKIEINRRIERMNIVRLLTLTRQKNASDLHITADFPPMIRHLGQLEPLGDEPLSAEEVRQIVQSILSDEQKKHFESDNDLDFSFSPTVDTRYRTSIYKQRGKTEAVFRSIMPSIKTRQELGLPDVIEDLCKLKNGIVIIAGTTGSGKTTTISTMIDIINRQKGGVVLVLEKPIEYLHKNIKAIIKQREVGVDVGSFATGLRAALRQDPDVIVVGEVLDHETMMTALEAAETGQLVITSLHATDVAQVFDRVVGFFPLEQRNFIYNRLVNCLKAVVVQDLMLGKDGESRVVATEVCMSSPAVKAIIRKGEFSQLQTIIQTSSNYKMHLMQDSIDNLFKSGLISAETYKAHSEKKLIS